MDCPPAVSPETANQVAILLDVLQALFDALWEALVPLDPAISWEKDPNSSEFMSHSKDLPLGAPLHAAPLPSAMRQCVQMRCHLALS